jgi:vancomycin resistance protein VanW
MLYGASLFMLRRPKWIKKSVATYHPLLYALAVGFRRVERRIEWLLDEQEYAKERTDHKLEYRVKKHQSVLIRRLSGCEDAQLQLNKIDNLRIVIQQLDGVLIRPGETFSFCKLVGKPTRKKGFRLGMELSRGCARAGIGGGICQASNLIYWLALHSPLEVVERYHHSFDPFSDKGRILPFASGATVMYNYRDLRLKNNTDDVFQLKLWLDKKCLNGDLWCSRRLRYSFSVYEKNHRFEQRDGQYFRSNELWRRVIDKQSGGMTIDHEFIVSNYAEVKYVPSPEKLESKTSVELRYDADKELISNSAN